MKSPTKPKQNKLSQVLDILGRKVFLPALIIFLSAETGMELDELYSLLEASE